MTREQLNRHMVLLMKDVLKVQKRMDTISKKLGVDENEDIKKIASEIQQLVRWDEK